MIVAARVRKCTNTKNLENGGFLFQKKDTVLFVRAVFKERTTEACGAAMWHKGSGYFLCENEERIRGRTEDDYEEEARREKMKAGYAKRQERETKQMRMTAMNHLRKQLPMRKRY